MLDFLNFLQYGFVHATFWTKVIYTLVVTHITILSVTIFLHRCQAHRALELNKWVSHFFRFWLWMTTGMITREWAAIHRKHHAFSDRDGDPHSPQVFGLKKVLLEGVELYQKEAENKETLAKYGAGTPDDWIERSVYSKHNLLGISIMLGINIALFGVIGIAIWAIQMIWIPFWAAGVINGVAHFVGYRNFECSDASRNIFPIGILIGGEELHNNHHTFGTSAKLSSKWYEFDIGWTWIKILSYFKLATVKKVSPVLNIQKSPKLIPDYQTLDAIIKNRYALMMKFTKSLKLECIAELHKMQSSMQEKISWAKLKKLLAKDEELLSSAEKRTISKIIENSQFLQKVFAMRQEIGELWQKSQSTKEELLIKLQKWCENADVSGIVKIKMFASNLRASY